MSSTILVERRDTTAVVTLNRPESLNAVNVEMRQALIDALAGLNEDALRAHCRELLAAYKVPKRIVQIDEMPRSLLGKILRKQVKDQMSDLV